MGFQQLVQQGTPRFVVRFLTRLADFYGIKITPPSFPSQKNSLHVLRMLGWKPVSCIDVGAYHGEWARMFLSVFPEAKVLMVEAQTAKEPVLKELAQASPEHLEYAIALLGDEDGKEVIFLRWRRVVPFTKSRATSRGIQRWPNLPSLRRCWFRGHLSGILQ